MEHPAKMHCFYRVISFLAFACCVRHSDSVVFDSEFEQKLDQFIQRTMDCRLIPGLSLAVVKGRFKICLLVDLFICLISWVIYAFYNNYPATYGLALDLPVSVLHSLHMKHAQVKGVICTCLGLIDTNVFSHTLAAQQREIVTGYQSSLPG